MKLFPQVYSIDYNVRCFTRLRLIVRVYGENVFEMRPSQHKMLFMVMSRHNITWILDG